ncbi:MAG: hypothetical protein HY245_03940 [Rhizobiales bacterium]|nr:hypothetical protein [Hyphomicrobiales bacterium]MBI3672573.1 hypothetical protein [Hyphomicrobiales bacterium]
MAALAHQSQAGIEAASQQAEAVLATLPTVQQASKLRAAVSRMLATCTESEVRDHILQLIGAFPNGRPPDPKTYIDLMVADAIATNLPDAAVEVGCVKLRRTKTFLPTIAEFLTACEAARARLQGICDLCDSLEERRAIAEQIIANANDPSFRREEPVLLPQPLVLRLHRPAPMPFPTLSSAFAGDKEAIATLASLDFNGLFNASAYLNRHGLEHTREWLLAGCPALRVKS